MRYTIFFLISLSLYSSNAIIADGLNISGKLLDHHTSAFKSNIIDPIVHGKKLSTIDKSEIASIEPLRCSDSVKSGEIVSVSYQYSDQLSISVEGDLDLDGSKEKSWRFSKVDGVCADGFIRCVFGWSDASCRYYKWDYSSGALSTKAVNTSDVNNCFCTNKSCGSVATSQKKEILGMILEGVVKDMWRYDKEHIFTESKNTGSIASQYALNQDGCEEPSQGLQHNLSFEKIKENILAEKAHQDAYPGLAYEYMKDGKDKDNVYTKKYRDYLDKLDKQEEELSESTKIDYKKSKVDYTSVTGKNESADLADLNLVPPIEKFCKVKKLEKKSIVYSDSSITDEEKRDTTKYSSIIRKCDNGACIYDNATEKIVENCSEHTNNFKEAVSKLQGLNEASKDMVCTK